MARTAILGLSFAYHDAAAALLVDGDLVAAASEERFTRRKHTSEFPAKAIQYCLEEAGLLPKDLTHVVFYEKPFVKFDRILTTYTSTWPKSYGAFSKALPVWMRDKLWLKQTIAEHLNTDAEMLFCEHHLSHAASAFLASPFEKAAILTLDGVGEWETATCGVGNGADFTLDRHIDYPHSLGLFYSALTAYLGFRVNDAEWKVMGLAPYGEPKYVEQFKEVIDIAPDGSFALDMRYFAHHTSESSMLTGLFEQHFGQLRRDPNSELTQFHKDIARSGQAIVEESMVGIANDLHKRHGCDNIVIGGGVGLNSVGNFRILEKTPFKDIFIQPASGDDGAAIGAALYIYHCVLGNPRKFQMRHAYYGPGYDDLAVETALRKLGVHYTKYEGDTVCDKAAELLMQGQVLGWFQGRMEFGPRALGNRSIIADPRNAAMKDIINAKVKYREWFRPFAPSVLKHMAAKYFELEVDSPFMLLVPRVRDEWREQLPAITHQDGTGRVQTVEQELNPRYFRLIEAFGRQSGVDVVLNTSFNVRGEPVVCSPEDAVRCFEKTGIDHLVIGSFIVSEKRAMQTYSLAEINELDIVPEMRIARKGDAGGSFSHAFGSLILTVLAVFAVLELSVRCLEVARFGSWSGAGLEQPIIYTPDRVFGNVLTPGTELKSNNGKSDIHVQINSLGWRGPETTVAKPAGRIRVACLGGSTTFGTSERDDAHTWVRQLEGQLRQKVPGADIEVLNFGVPGYELMRNLEQLIRVVPQFAPDYVVLFQGYNDTASLGTGVYQLEAPPATGWMHDHSLLVRRWKAWRSSRAQRDPEAVAERNLLRKDNLPPQALATFEATLRAFVATAGTLHVQPIVVTQVCPFAPDGGQVAVGTDEFLLSKGLQFRPHLTPKGLRDSVRAINGLERKVAADTAPTVLIDAAKEWPFTADDFFDDIHFTEQGSTRFATLLADRIAPLLRDKRKP